MSRSLLAALAMGFLPFIPTDAEAGNCREFTRSSERSGYVEFTEGVECWRWNGWQTVSQSVSRYPRYADNVYFRPNGSILNVTIGDRRRDPVVIVRRDRDWGHRGNHRGHHHGKGHDRHDKRGHRH